MKHSPLREESSLRRSRLLPLGIFVLCVPVGFAMGITLIGHGRPFPYTSVWIDRLVLGIVGLSFPFSCAFITHRLLHRKRP